MDASFEVQRPLLQRISVLIFRPEISRALLVFIGLLPAMALLADIYGFAVNVPFMDVDGRPPNIPEEEKGRQRAEHKKENHSRRSAA